MLCTAGLVIRATQDDRASGAPWATQSCARRGSASAYSLARHLRAHVPSRLLLGSFAPCAEPQLAVMGRGPRWSEEEDSALLELIALHGVRWCKVFAVWRGRSDGRTLEQLRHRYRTMREASTAAEQVEGSDAGSSCESIVSAEADGGQAGQEAAVAAISRQYAPVRPAVLELVPLPQRVRTLWCGRSWSSAVYSHMRASASDACLRAGCRPGHTWLVQALRLHVARAPHRLLYCDLARAERLWERHLRAGGATGSLATLRGLMKTSSLSLEERDRMHMVLYPDEPLPCLLASGFHRCWIGGQDAGVGFYANADLSIAWLGLGAAHPARQLARGCARYLPPSALYSAAGDAISMAWACAVVGGAARLVDGGLAGTLRTGSLYAGAFSTFAAALEVEASYWDVPRVVLRTFAAEVDARRRQCLNWAAPYDVIYNDAARAARHGQRLDVLDWTPTCVNYSQAAVLAPRARGSNAAATRRRRQRARGSMLAAGLALVRCIRRVQPRLVLGEQVAGLSTHHGRYARRLLLRLLAAVPYAWFAATADAARLRAPSHRKREALVGVHVDSLAVTPPKRCVGGRWWCQRCECTKHACRCTRSAPTGASSACG